MSSIQNSELASDYKPILYVEDDLLQAMIVKPILEDHGYTVTHTDNGASALELIASTPFLAIITDYSMPEMNGNELIKHLRRKGYTLPAITLTGHADPKVAFEASQHEAFDFIIKDSDNHYLDGLIVSLDLAIKKHKLKARYDEAHQQLQKQKELSDLAFDSLEEGIIVLDHTFAAQYINQQALSILGLKKRAEETRYLTSLRASLLTRLIRTDEENTVWTLPQSTLSTLFTESSVANGDYFEIWTLEDQCYRIQSKQLGTQGYVITLVDISQQKQSLIKAEHLANHDALTGLPNRLLMIDRLSSAVSQAKRSSSKVGVIVLDLDHFKQINDTLGHMAGDELLKVIGNRMATTVRESDTVCRIGGDEFVIIVPGIKYQEDLTILCEKIIEYLIVPIQIDKTELRITTSIGCSIGPDDSTETADLLKYADIALYKAKQNGRNQYALFNTHQPNAPASTQ